jgi:hypothetical protein
MKRALLIVLCVLSTIVVKPQQHKSIHQLETEWYNSLGFTKNTQFDSLNEFKSICVDKHTKNQLVKKVFGYHPYWGGSNYLNYQWNLLSDFCHFSYEVDPETGNPTTTHDWETSPAIDSALANNVKVHLCVTLFSGHATFFNNTSAQQTLISNTIDLLQSRGAHGINMDVEALPSAYKDAFTDFMVDLCNQVQTAIPGSEISMAAPAVNWNDKFNIPALKQCLDLFVVMGYDYYWSGSDFAGPVSPLYSMTGNYDYNFSRTISYYQSQGVPNEKIIMAVPYYAYEWPTVGAIAPSSTLGTAVPKTYRSIKDNASGNYIAENKHSEPNSFGPYYSFDANGWYQCFIDDTYSMGEKYNIINRRNLGGIGIWALGYDNGYTDFWNLIDQKFTTNASVVALDTIYDSGGPGFSYYNNEAYSYTVSVNENSRVYFLFLLLNLEENFDTLWVFDGPDETSPLIDFYSGDSIPSLITSTSNFLTLKFYSDAATTEGGWMAVYDTTMWVQNAWSGSMLPEIKLELNPNPFVNYFVLDFELDKKTDIKFWLTDLTSQKTKLLVNRKFMAGKHSLVFEDALNNIPAGTWLFIGELNNQQIVSRKIIRMNP